MIASSKSELAYDEIMSRIQDVSVYTLIPGLTNKKHNQTFMWTGSKTLSFLFEIDSVLIRSLC
jgi:hypothetical protein